MPDDPWKEWIRKAEGDYRLAVLVMKAPCDDITGIDQFRYPSDFANENDAKLALKSARIIRKFVREKFHPARPRAKKRK